MSLVEGEAPVRRPRGWFLTISAPFDKQAPEVVCIQDQLFVYMLRGRGEQGIGLGPGQAAGM
jgi:hypothetical protein